MRAAVVSDRASTRSPYSGQADARAHASFRVLIDEPQRADVLQVERRQRAARVRSVHPPIEDEQFDERGYWRPSEAAKAESRSARRWRSERMASPKPGTRRRRETVRVEDTAERTNSVLDARIERAGGNQRGRVVSNARLTLAR